MTHGATSPPATTNTGETAGESPTPTVDAATTDVVVADDDSDDVAYRRSHSDRRHQCKSQSTAPRDGREPTAPVCDTNTDRSAAWRTPPQS